MKHLILALILFNLSSCTRHDPNPETKDDIYNDLLIELDIANKAVESETKLLDSLRKELEKAVPQTGQIKYATQKVRNAESVLAELNQRKIYFDIKKEQRKAYVQQRYQESLAKDGRPWPDTKEIEVYRSLAKFNREKLEWDKNKGMKKAVPRGTKVEPEDSGGDTTSKH